MAVRPIRIVGDPVLHTPTRPVEAVDDDLRTLVADMFDTMAAAHGVGLAANQVGVPCGCSSTTAPTSRPRRACAASSSTRRSRPRRGRRPCPIPRTTTRAASRCPTSSSRPGARSWARVTGTDLEGAAVTVEGTGFLARCLQHETDHLDGVLYLDRLVGRNQRAARKAVKRNGWGVPGLAWNPAIQDAEAVRG